MARDGDPEHLTLHPPVEALHETVGLRRVGFGRAMLQLQLAAGLLEAIAREAGSSVGEHVRDLEGKRADRLVQEGDCAGGQLVVLDRQMHPARAAVDRHIEEALAALAVSGCQLRQVLDVYMDEAEIVVLERAALPFALLRRRQTAQAFGFEDAVDGIAVEMGQEVRDDEGQIIERKAGRAAQSTDNGPLFLRGFPGQLVRPAAVVLAVLSSALAPLADGLGAHAEALGQHAGGLSRAGDLLTDRRGGAGLRVDGQHHVLLR
jgi:transposase